MRVPVSLLRELVDVPQDLEHLAAVLNARVSEIERVERFPGPGELEGLSIVAGESQARLVDAQGEPVTESALGIGEDAQHAVTLGPDVQDGAEVYEVLGLDDAVLHFDLEPNRPDLFSVLGVARDASAIWKNPLRSPKADPTDWAPLQGIELQVEAADQVHRYCALEVSGIRVGPSPQWLQNAVRKLGMRPINNIVDATNLVMLELGEPMHTFDRRQLKTGTIGLRLARSGESMTTLDGVERELTPECLLVTDGDTPIALAGIMGSEGSGIEPDTSDIVIEAACFDMATVRRASRLLALRTESSLRFEKGLPATGVLPAMARLVHLLRQVGGPEVRVGGFAEYWPSPPSARETSLRPEALRARLAMDVSDARIREILEASGCEVGADWSVSLPPHRPDLCITEDLYEEVGRIHGYEHVRAELPIARLQPPPRNPLFWRADQVRESLVAHGLDEVYLGPWFGDAEVERFGLDSSVLVELKNPLVETLRYFRSTPLPGIAATVQENAKLFGHFGFFEIGTLYRRESSGIAETPRLAGAVVGPGEDLDGARVLQVRDTLVAMLDHLGIPSVIRRSETTGDVVDLAQLHPGRWGALACEDGAHLGVFGELHPRLARAVGLKVSPVIFSVDLGVVYERAGDGVQFRPPPRFPSVESHVNVLAPDRMMASDLLARVDSPDLVRRTIRDVWTGEGVPAGRRRLTLELEFNRPDRSLTHEEVMERLVGLKAALESASDLTVEIPA